MSSLIVSIIGWVVGKIFGKQKDEKLKKKYAAAKKENYELRAENAGLRVVKEIEDKEEEIQSEWEEAKENDDIDKQLDILRRDFDD